MKLLIVDDETRQLRLYKRFLCDHEVSTASDPEQVADICADEGPPDLLICDVQMPGIDGFGLYRRLSQTFPNLPVLFVSAYFDGPAPDGTQFLSKPVSRETLVKAVESFRSQPSDND